MTGDGSGVEASGVRWQILGPVAATRGGTSLELGGWRQRAMVALLLSRAGTVVPLSSVVDALWGQDPPPTAVNVVHRYVGSLRRVVQPDLGRRVQGKWLLSDTGGHRVVVDEESLDLSHFRALIRRAQGLPAGPERLELYLQALALWRGPVAADVAGELAGDAVLAAITGEHAAAAVQAGEEALPLGRADRALPALDLARQVDPTDEVVHAVWIRCLSSAGQRAAALDGFEKLRIRLADELGISPGPALATTHLAVLRDDIAVTVRGRALLIPRQLPASPTGFVGRTEQVRQLISALLGGPDGPTASVVTGTAGVGKTALAVHVAHTASGAFPDGHLYVDLRGFDPTESPLSPHEVLGRFLTALDVPADRVPATVEERAALFRSGLAERRVLVVLDNARDTAEFRDLLPGIGPARAIVTSRRQLRALAASGVQPVSLDLFDDTEADQFLRTRLGDRPVDQDRVAARALIHSSGRLPIALSLLTARAAHSPHAPLGELAVAVRSAQAALDPFADRADPRTSARAVLSWSFRAADRRGGTPVHPDRRPPRRDAHGRAVGRHGRSRP